MSCYEIAFEGTVPLKADIALPASKSISNRLLVLHYLSNKRIQITNLSEANDTRLLQSILSQASLPHEIDCKDAGTVFRFLLSLCAAQPNQQFKLWGTPRLMKRPHDILIKALLKLGATIAWQEHNEYVEIIGTPLKSKHIKLRGDISSQFISSLCLVACTLPHGLSLHLEEPILSRPYIDMTINLLQQVGIPAVIKGNDIHIPPTLFSTHSVEVENDWSSACFFYALVMLSPSAELCLKNLSLPSLQGDAYISKLSAHFHIQTIEKGKDIWVIKEREMEVKPQNFDLSHFPDLAIPIITICAYKYPQISFSGLEHITYKESNRFLSLQKELTKLGIKLHMENGRINSTHTSTFGEQKAISFCAHDDHRIAMSISLLGLQTGKILLDNVGCVQKSFPDFYGQLKKLGFSLKAC